jgi:arylsulfatase
VFGANVVAAQFLETFNEFPPRQRAASFSIDQAVDRMKQHIGGH